MFCVRFSICEVGRAFKSTNDITSVFPPGWTCSRRGEQHDLPASTFYVSASTTRGQNTYTASVHSDESWVYSICLAYLWCKKYIFTEQN